MKGTNVMQHENGITYLMQKRDNLVLRPKLLFLNKRIVDRIERCDRINTFLEIGVVMNGKGSIYIENQCYSVEKGNMFIYNALSPHSEISTGSEFEIMSFGLAKLNLPSLEENVMITKKTSPILHDDGVLKNRIEWLAYEIENQKTFHESMMQGIISTIVVDIMRLTAFQPSGENYDDPFIRATNYIDEHYMENIKLDDICNNAYVSKYYLSRNYREYMGMTVVDYITKKRIDASKYLLEETAMSIKDIAHEVGYDDEMYFSKKFKSITSKTPQQYRLEK